MNKVIARFADGRLLKGMTADFFPNRDVFHLSLESDPPEKPPVEIDRKELKALFFVKDFAGDSEHVKRRDFDPARHMLGRRIKVEFWDGEILVGTTQGYQPGRPGFFVEIADAESNNDRCFVISAATKRVEFL